MTVFQKCSLIILLSIVAVLLSCRDTVESSYSSLVDAQATGELEHGWVPRIVPPESHGIKEIHNIDTNQVWGTFQFQSRSVEMFKNSLKMIDFAEIAGRSISKPDVKWWPSVLSGQIQKDELSKANLVLYKIEQGGTVFLAVNWTNNEVYFWRY
jgi:hypothetical protein